MRSVRAPHIVVVTDGNQGPVFAGHLRRMGLGEITTVACLDEARRLCRAGGIDACIVAIDYTMPDARPATLGDAPGCGCGVPTLMMVAGVSPDLRKLARQAGYVALIPTGIAPRMLYRRVRAALQGRPTVGPARRRLPAITVMTRFTRERTAMSGKPTLH